MKEKTFVAVFLIWTLISLLILGGIIYIVIHFIGKYW